MKELEFIFVDDCGTDNSMDAVYEWANQDPRVVVLINDRNLGEGGSRNRGIAAAKGEYINTVDPDDWVASDYYELLYAKATETSADIIKGIRIPINEKTGREVLPRSACNEKIQNGLANGEPLYLSLNIEHQTVLFKRSIWDREITYGTSANGADTTFLLRLCAKTSSFAREDQAIYYYLRRSDSATGDYSLKRSRNELISLEEQIDHFLQKGIFDSFAYRYLASRYDTYTTRFLRVCQRGTITAKEKECYITDLKKQIQRIPGYENLYALRPEMVALMKLDRILARSLFENVPACKKEVADWMAYLSVLDGKPKEDAIQKLEHLFDKYIQRKRKKGLSRLTIGRELLQIDAQWKHTEQKEIMDALLKRLILKRIIPQGKKAD